MADYQSNFLSALQGGYNFGQQIKQQQDSNKLKGLAALAQGATREQRQPLLQQMAGISPEFAQQQRRQWSGDDEADQQELISMARFIKSAPPEQQAAAYTQILPKLRERGMQAPDWTPQTQDMILKTVDSLVGAYGDPQGGQGGLGVQSTFVDGQGNRVAIMRDGTTQVVGQNAPNNQIIDTGNGFYGVNKGSLSASPVMVGGQPQQPTQGVPSATFVAEDGSIIPTQQFAASDGSAARFDPGVPQHVRDQILAQPTSFGGAPDQSTAMLPPTNRNPQQFGGGQQLYSAPKGDDVPAGYRRSANGDLEYIPGGPADPFVRNERTSPTAAKPIPAQSLGKVLEAQEALGSTRVISDIIKKHADRMQSGELVVGPVDTVGAKFRTGLGMANQQDVNLNEWEADKTKIVNESLRLNKGVQTEGDSQRAIQELMGARDQATAARALRRLAEINSRAVQLQQEKLRTIYRNYGRGPDGEPVQSAPTQGAGVDDLLSKYGAN